MKLLLATGQVDIESKDIQYGQTPLSWAAEKGHEAVVKLLLATGQVDIHSTDLSGTTALQIARSFGRTAIVEILEKSGGEELGSV